MRTGKTQAFFLSAVMTAAMLLFAGTAAASESAAQEEMIAENGLSEVLQAIPVCSRSFAKSLNASNTEMWIYDPRQQPTKTPCCMNGVICLPEPGYGQYVVARPELQKQYDCSREAQNRHYTPVCRVVVGQALDPFTICPKCVPVRMNFWAIVYRNDNQPAPPPPAPTPTPALCGGKICQGKTRCINGHCVPVR